MKSEEVKFSQNLMGKICAYPPEIFRQIMLQDYSLGQRGIHTYIN